MTRVFVFYRGVRRGITGARGKRDATVKNNNMIRRYPRNTISTPCTSYHMPIYIIDYYFHRYYTFILTSYVWYSERVTTAGKTHPRRSRRQMRQYIWNIILTSPRSHNRNLVTPNAKRIKFKQCTYKNKQIWLKELF